MIFSLPSASAESQTQPEPKSPAPLAWNSAWNFSNEPKSRAIAPAIFPSGAFPSRGARNCRKYIAWFSVWPALLKSPPSAFATISSSDLPSKGLPGSAAFRLST